MRHVLTNVVGARDQVNVHISEFPLVDGDAYLLCSDGLYEPLGDDESSKSSRTARSRRAPRPVSCARRSRRAPATT